MVSSFTELVHQTQEHELCILSTSCFHVLIVIIYLLRKLHSENVVVLSTNVVNLRFYIIVIYLSCTDTSLLL